MRKIALCASATAFLALLVVGCGNKEIPKDEEAKVRSGMQNTPKTIGEVPPQYQDMVRNSMGRNGPPTGPPQAPK
jgi:hypothetical protein